MAELADELDLGTDALLRIITAFGLARPDPGSALHAPDVENLRAFVRAWRPLGDDDVLVRAARAYGDALRRAAEGWMGIFDDVVLGPLDGRAIAWDEMRGRVLQPGLPVLAVSRSMLPWLLDQHLSRLLNQLNLASIERQLALLGIAPAVPREPSAIVFTDLAGYTSLTEERGDEVAAEAATRLAALADEIARSHDGRLVKLLGDGVMLHFPRAADAVRAAVELRDASERAGLPLSRTGIHAGGVIRRESDFYGRTVNVAARLATAAAPGDVLVTTALVEAARDGGATLPELEAVPPLELKGISDPVAALRVLR